MLRCVFVRGARVSASCCIRGAVHARPDGGAGADGRLGEVADDKGDKVSGDGVRLLVLVRDPAVLD